METKKSPKINQNSDVKQKTITGVRQLKEYLYNKRANLTYEEIDKLIDNVTKDTLTFGYESGWDSRNEISQVRKANVKARLIRAFNDFYNENLNKVTVEVLEKVHYLVDIALLNRYFNETLPFEHQMNDMKHF